MPHVSLHEAIGGEWGAFRGLYDPRPLALREGDVITHAISEPLSRPVVQVPLDEPFVVKRDGWYVIELDTD